MQGLKGRGRHVALAGWRRAAWWRFVLPVTGPGPSAPFHPDGRLDGRAEVKAFLTDVMKGDPTGAVTGQVKGEGLTGFLTGFTWSRP